MKYLRAYKAHVVGGELACMRARRLAVFLLCISFLLAAAAQPSATDPWFLSQWQRKVWQIEDGLPHNDVTGITQNASGRLLVGTKGGIVAFDGFTFASYPALADMWITALVQSSDGTLWAGASHDGLYRIRQGQATKVADGTFYSLTQGNDGRIWGVSEAGAGYVQDDRFHLAVKGTDTGVYGWQPTGQDTDGTLWFAAREGLFRFRSGENVPMKLKGTEGLPVTVYLTPATHQLYLGTTRRLYRLSCNDTSCASTAINGVQGPIVGLRQAFDRTLWIATWGRGVYRLSPESGRRRVETMDIRSGLADEFVRTLYEDSEHTMWVGTRGGGLTRFRTTILKPFGLPEGMEGNCASAAAGDGEGGVWLGTWRSGLFHWNGDQMTAQPLPNERLGVLITALAVDSAHDLWVGSFSGFWVLRHGKTKAETLPGKGPETSLRQIFFARDGSLWVLQTNGKASMYPSGDPRTSAARRVLPSEQVTYVSQDSHGTMWAGTRNGLWRVSDDGSSSTHVLLSSSPLVSISEDRQQRLWTTYEDGSVVVQTPHGTVPFSTSTLPNKLLYKVNEDPEGSFWFSTGLGPAWASGKDVERALRHPGEPVNAVGLGVADGARTIECRCAQHPQGWAGADGVMWIPTSKGFVQADPRRNDRRAAPPAVVDSVRWDGSVPLSAGAVTMPAGAHNLQVSFTAVRPGTADNVRFRYKLEGVDDRWIDADRGRVARYTQVRPGKHQFLVQARDAMGAWGEPAEVSITQKPHLYQTVWFECLMIALVPVLFAMVYWLRLRGVHSRYNAVLEERGRIAREWHDTLLAGLSAIGWQLDGAIHNCEPAPLRTSLTNVRSMLRYCREEAQLAVEGLRHDSLVSRDLKEKLQETLEQMTQGGAVRLDLEVDPALPTLSAQVNQALLRICQEAVTNAIRHGIPKVVSVSLTYRDGVGSLCVRDDGSGMNPAVVETPPPGHYGLLGMRERVQRIGGRLEITSAPGKGTMVEVEVPVVA